jgi:flap endonuclease-1
MGVKITPLVEDVKKTITFKNLLGKKIAIDAFNTLYQFMAIIRGKDGSPLKDLKGNPTSHLSGIFYRTLNILEQSIKPIFVFDGPPNPLKYEEIERRRAIRKDATKKMKEAQDLGKMEDAVKFAQATSKLNSVMIDESKELLAAMGVPIIQAAQDGEAQAAYMVNNNIAWAVGSQDYDSLLFGASRIVRNLSQNRTRKVKSITIKVDLEWLTLSKVLENSELSLEELVDIGILVGVDFFPGVSGIGPKTAIKLIKEHKSIENIINNNIQFRKKPIDLDLAKILQVQNIFLKPEIKKDFDKPKWRRPNPELIKEILCERHDFNNERIENALKRFSSINSSSTQKTLEGFLKKK